VRDDVLARLLALNAERYAEEVALGLQGKGGKTGGAALGSKRRGRPEKVVKSDENPNKQVAQINLLF